METVLIVAGIAVVLEALVLTFATFTLAIWAIYELHRGRSAENDRADAYFAAAQTTFSRERIEYLALIDRLLRTLQIEDAKAKPIPHVPEGEEAALASAAVVHNVVEERLAAQRENLAERRAGVGTDGKGSGFDPSLGEKVIEDMQEMASQLGAMGGSE